MAKSQIGNDNRKTEVTEVEEAGLSQNGESCDSESQVI